MGKQDRMAPSAALVLAALLLVPSLAVAPALPPLPGVPAVPGAPEVPDLPGLDAPVGMACGLAVVPSLPLFAQPPKQAVVDRECGQLRDGVALLTLLRAAGMDAPGALLVDGQVVVPTSELDRLQELLGAHAAATVAQQTGAANAVIDDVAPNGTATLTAAVTNTRALPAGPLVGGVRVDSVTLLDTLPPVAAAQVAGLAGTEGWLVGPASVTLACTDGAGSGCVSVAYRLDDGPAQSASPGAVVAVAGQGNHTLRFQGTDAAGNVQAERSVAFGIDSVAPVASATARGTPGNAGWFLGPVVVDLACSDATSGCAQVATTLDGGAALAVLPGSSRAVATDGAHALAFAGKDHAGNTQPQQSIPVRIDRQAPITTATLAGILQAGSYRGQVTVHLACADGAGGSGCANTTFQLDGAGPTVGTTVTVATEGEHILRYASTDTAGNAEAVRALVLPVDATPPSTGIALQGPQVAAPWFTGPVTASFTCTDTRSGCAATESSLDGDAFVAGTERLVAGDAEHSLAVRSTDAAGNVAPATEQAVRIDGVPPTTTLSIVPEPSASGWSNVPLVVSLSCADAVSGCARSEAALDDDALAEATAFDLAEGAHTLVFRSIDAAGNVEAQQVRDGLRIDTLAPVTTFTATGIAGLLGWYASPVALALACDDGSAGSGCDGPPAASLDGAPAEARDALTLGDGERTLTLRSRDVAGNVEPVQTRTFLVDATPPVTTAQLNGPRGDAGWFTGPVTVSFACADATSGCAATRAGEGEALGEGPLELRAEGAHAVAYASTDVAGNAEAARHVVARIDSLAPVVAIRSPRDGSVPGAFLVRFDVAEANDYALRCAVDNVPQSCGGNAWSVQFDADGDHVLAVKATDEAGNAGSATVRVRVEINPAAPSIAILPGAPVNAQGWAAAP
ncbi:MAG: hypothetical protein LC624_12220, partial [Halobacteriales archaeon]|nr:hypothetical protein [Halobacteriales archaeon]